MQVRSLLLPFLLAGLVLGTSACSDDEPPEAAPDANGSGDAAVASGEEAAAGLDEQQPDDLTDEDITAFGASVRDLLDEEQRAAAWRR